MACKEMLGVDSLIEVNSSTLTHQQIVDYLSCLSGESFQSRMPVVVYLSVITVLGFFGNVLVLAVYWTDKNLLANRTFIMFMAIHDLTTSVLGLPLQILTIRYAYDTFSLSFCRTMFAAATLPTQSSSVVLVAVAVDRLQLFWCPHKRRISFPSSVKTSVVLTIVVCVVFGAFVPLYGTHSARSGVQGLPVQMCWTYDGYKDTWYLDTYSDVVEWFFYGSIVVLTVAYLTILYKLSKKRFHMVSVKPASSSAFTVEETDLTTVAVSMWKRTVFHKRVKRTRISTHTTRMMAVLTGCYIVNWVPHLIARKMYTDPVNLCPQLVNCGGLRYNLYALGLRSYYLNSAINVFVYSFMCGIFRRSCLRLICKHWIRLVLWCCCWSTEKLTGPWQQSTELQRGPTPVSGL